MIKLCANCNRRPKRIRKDGKGGGYWATCKPCHTIYMKQYRNDALVKAKKYNIHRELQTSALAMEIASHLKLPRIPSSEPLQAVLRAYGYSGTDDTSGLDI